MTDQPGMPIEVDAEQMIAVLREEVANLNDQKMQMLAIIRTQQQALAVMQAEMDDHVHD